MSKYTVTIEVDPAAADQALSEVKREIGFRRAVYPRFVQSGRITQAKADEQMHRMQVAEKVLREVVNTMRQPFQQTQLDFLGEDGK